MPQPHSLSNRQKTNNTSYPLPPPPIPTTVYPPALPSPPPPPPPRRSRGKEVKQSDPSSFFNDAASLATTHTEFDSSSPPPAPHSPQTAYPSSRVLPQPEFLPSPLSTRSANASLHSTVYSQVTQVELPIQATGVGNLPYTSSGGTVKALNDAITAGFSSSPRVKTPVNLPPRTLPLRMPLQSSSPQSSVYEQGQAEAIPPPNIIDAPEGSTSPCLTGLQGLGINNPGMSTKVPATRRPARLNMEAVREFNRSSLTSLTDLIRRAAKVASNLDRSNTASRLSRLGKFDFTDHRQSSLSDMISSFPAPASGSTPRGSTPLRGTPGRESLWPRGEKVSRLDSHSSGEPPKRKRRCCGMSLRIAVLVFIVLVLIIALAVLLPILLVVVPHEHKDNPTTVAQCSKSNKCLNGGMSTVVNGNCECVCSDGFSGQTCADSAGGVDCTSATLKDGSTTYTNATMGTLVKPLFHDAESFNIPLNASIILSTFASNDLSCSAENTLVNLNSTLSHARRFIIFHSPADVDPQPQPVTTAPSTTFTTATKSHGAAARRGESTAGSSDGIVFQTSAASGQESTATASSGASSSTTTTATTTASNSTSSSAASPKSTSATAVQQNFAQLVVLYALQQSYTVAFAANAQQSIRLYFSGVSSGNDSVQVGTEALPLTVDFAKLTITNADGTVVGGSGT